MFNPQLLAQMDEVIPVADNNHPTDEDTGDIIPAPIKEPGSESEIPTKVKTDEKDPHDPANVDIVIDLDQNRDPERQAALKAELKKVHNSLFRLEQLLDNSNHGRVGQEGFANFAKNSLSGLGNILGHIANLFGTALFHGWRDFKRSELAAYKDSNLVTMQRLFATDFVVVSNFKLPTPQGMQGSYAEALNSLIFYLNNLDMLERANKMMDIVKGIQQDLHKVNPSFSSHVANVNKVLIPSQLEKDFDKTSKYFTTNKNDAEIFSKLFRDMGEFKQVIADCITADSHLRGVAAVHSRLENLEREVGNIVNEEVELKPAAVDDLVKIIRTFSEVFANYSTAVNDLQRVNHNLTHVLITMRKLLKM